MPHYFLLAVNNRRLHLQKPITERTCLPFALDSTFLTATFMHSCLIVSLLYLCSVFVTTRDVKTRFSYANPERTHTQDEWHRN